MNRCRPHAWVVLLASGCALAGGCTPARDQRFVPSDEAAQGTLEVALAAWRNGKPPPCLAQESGPAIQLVDTHHKKDQKLLSFSVLGPTTGDAQRCYAVRLTFENPREEVRARYVVLGLDPLWVMRYEDYEMVSHWNHAMPEKGAGPKKEL